MTAASQTWIWLDEAVLLAVHQEQLVEHGGGAGVRDIGLLQSGLARARHLAQYGEPDAAALAAAYGFGIARNHPFIDGNKRTAFVAIELFLELNGFALAADDAASVLTMLAMAAGSLDEAGFTEWVRAHTVSNVA